MQRGARRRSAARVATPFLTLSFLALSVIPKLKITDRGLVDVDRFEIVPLALLVADCSVSAAPTASSSHARACAASRAATGFCSEPAHAVDQRSHHEAAGDHEADRRR